LIPRSLLLIDADPAMKGYLSGLLQRDDHEVQQVPGSKEALSLLRTGPIDLVLAGQGNNGFDGLALLRRVRSIRPSTKVILTGDSDPERILAAILQRAFGYLHRPLAPGPLGELVQQALDCDTWQDDIRVVSGRPEWITLDVRCKIDAADRTTHFLREITAHLSAQVGEDVSSAFRELLMNAIEHGGRSDPQKHVRTSILHTARAIIVHIHDPGTGFSLDFLPHAAISNPEDSPIRHVEVRAEEGRRPGGFGILLTKNLVDELLYNERGNAVLFVKYL
jgi:anti-sigma regulatory factor (Ser/Thr protein kinase)/ActR/RegA family two-component response regulator